MCTVHKQSVNMQHLKSETMGRFVKDYLQNTYLNAMTIYRDDVKSNTKECRCSISISSLSNNSEGDTN